MHHLIIALFLLQSAPQSPVFKFAKQQRVYVVAVEAKSRDLNSTRADLEIIERAAKDQFMKVKAFRVAE